jgi:hypothetical protein
MELINALAEQSIPQDRLETPDERPPASGIATLIAFLAAAHPLPHATPRMAYPGGEHCASEQDDSKGGADGRYIQKEADSIA